jgi:RHS repeat-associated protein
LGTLELKKSGAGILKQKIAYDAISWVDAITDESTDGNTQLHKFDYAFQAGTPFVGAVQFAAGGVAVMTQSYSHDALGRFAGTSVAKAGGGALRGVSYQFDALDRRYQADWNDGTLWSYSYNDKSEVTGGRKKFVSGAFVGGSQYEYSYDDIGNRIMERSGGDAAGANLRESLYGDATALNQLTTRTVPGAITVTGEAPVTLSLQGFADGQPFSLTRQEGESFFGEAVINNTAWSAYPKLKVVGKSGVGTLDDMESGAKFVARTPEAFSYDGDGNLTSDGRWSYGWDAESRLIGMETRVEAASAGAPRQKLVFGYDAANRRYKKELYNWNVTTGGYILESVIYYVYNGWTLIGELNATLNPQRVYEWGLDLSRTEQGAGGVGGLLAMKDIVAGKTYYYTYDGNGNVQQVVDSSTGNIVADYVYGPFGEIVRASGPLAKLNRFRFSTKYTDDESGLVYYGYRYYAPSLGRWINRDPIEEKGGVNLYGMAGNQIISAIDAFGMAELNLDRINCKAILKIRVKFNFRNEEHRALMGSRIYGDPWTVYRMHVFMLSYKYQIEKVWNNTNENNIRLDNDSKNPKDCPCECKGKNGGLRPWNPQLELEFTQSSQSADWIVNVISGMGDIGESTVPSRVDEQAKQNIVESEAYIQRIPGRSTLAHEAGHSLGNQHPGYGMGLDSHDEYRFKGVNKDGIQVDGSNEIMGLGTKTVWHNYLFWLQKFEKDLGCKVLP